MELKKNAIWFSENEGGGAKGGLELFRKFIRFGGPTRAQIQTHKVFRNFLRESEANFERLNLVMQTGGGDLIMSNARWGKILKEIPLSFDAKANYY